MTKKVVLVFLPLMIFLIYILDLDPIYTNLFFQVIVWFFTLLIIVSIEEYGENIDSVYRGIKELSLLSEYISKEREEFSEILHDEIIQDIVSSYNLLELNEPDIYKVKKILERLESKSRRIMNFYGTNTFYEFDSYDNIENIMESIRPIYPNKDIQLNLYINEEIKRLDRLHLIGQFFT